MKHLSGLVGGNQNNELTEVKRWCDRIHLNKTKAIFVVTGSHLSNPSNINKAFGWINNHPNIKWFSNNNTVEELKDFVKTNA